MGDGDDKADTDDGRGPERSQLNRRSYLKLAGLSLGGLAIGGGGADVASASSSGFGAGGYGAGAYGDATSDASLTLSTKSATAVEATQATLQGTLLEMGGASSVHVYFQWGRAGGRLSNTTSVQTVSSTGSFSATIDGLSPETEYEYRAFAYGSSEAAMGGDVPFTTAGVGIDLGSSTTLLPRDGDVVNCSFDSNHAGYTGDGFVNFPDSGGYVEWTVYAATSTKYELSIRYALGDSGRLGALAVGDKTQFAAVDSTGSWDNWETTTTTVTVPEGTSTIRISSFGYDFGNVDAVELREV